MKNKLQLLRTLLGLFITILILYFTSFQSLAATSVIEKKIEGTIEKVTYIPGTGNAGNVVISAKNAVVVNKELWSPDATHNYFRLIVDIKNTSIKTMGTLTVNKGSVKQIRYAQSDSTRSRFVIDLSVKPDYEVKATSANIQILLNGAKSVATVPAGTSSTSTATGSGTPTPTTTTGSGTSTSTGTATGTTSKPAASTAPAVKPATTTPDANSTQTTVAKPSTGVSTGSTASSTNSKLTAIIATLSQKGPFSWTMQNGTCVLKIANTDLLAMQANGSVSIENRTRERILQITFLTIDPRFITGAISGNDVIFGGLISTNFTKQTTTMRISGRTPLIYTIQKSGMDTLITLKNDGSNPVASRPNSISTIVPGNTIASTSGTGTSSTVPSGSTEIPTVNTGTTIEPNASPAVPGTGTSDNTTSDRGVGRVLPVSFVATGTNVTITSDDVSSSRVFRLGKNIVIEVPGVAVANTLAVNSPLIQDVTSVSTAGRVRLTVRTSVFSTWTVDETAGRLVVTFTPLDMKNIEGGDDQDVVLRLTSPGIGERYRTMADSIMIDEDLQLQAFAFVFPISLIDLGTGIAKTNDLLSKDISTLTSGSSSFLSIAKRDNATQFKLVAEPDGNTLTIRKSVAETPVYVPTGGKRLVVLDAGHGGADPGAVFEGVYESSVNLDITLRAEAILLQQGVNVQLTRRTNVGVSLDDRCNIANNMNASLFVSIHQNSMPDPATRGSMTMYYATSVNGRRYAEIMQQALVSTMGLGDLGLKTSSQMVVLRKTKMPAVLAEIACMSNSQDMQSMKTDQYRQNAANAIATSVLQILATMN